MSRTNAGTVPVAEIQPGQADIVQETVVQAVQFVKQTLLPDIRQKRRDIVSQNINERTRFQRRRVTGSKDMSHFYLQGQSVSSLCVIDASDLYGADMDWVLTGDQHKKRISALRAIHGITEW